MTVNTQYNDKSIEIRKRARAPLRTATALSSQDEFEREANEMRTINSRLSNIEEKNRCMRVQFLDWLSAKLSNWSKAIKEMSDRIDSPCAIKVPENLLK